MTQMNLFMKQKQNRGHREQTAAAAANSLQSCPTLCYPIDGSPPGSTVPGILQARTLERVAISFSNAWKWKVKVKSLSHVRLFATPWTAAYQAPPSLGFLLQCRKVNSQSEVAQSCLILSDPMDCSLPGSSVHGIFQAKEYWSGVPLPSPNNKRTWHLRNYINLIQNIKITALKTKQRWVPACDDFTDTCFTLNHSEVLLSSHWCYRTAYDPAPITQSAAI